MGMPNLDALGNQMIFAHRKRIVSNAAQPLEAGQNHRERELRTKTLRYALCLSLGSLLFAVATAAVAQENNPSRPIRFVVGWAPGGAADYLARLVGRELGERFGQQVIVDNRPGASGVIGANMVAKAMPDGYTLLLGEMGSLVLSPHLQDVPYDTVRDFAGVSILANMYHVLVLHPSVRARSVKELIALANDRPGELKYATGGAGGNMFLVFHLFKSSTGTDMVHVPYKSAGPAAMAVLAGETQLMFSSITPVLPHIRSNRLVAIAVTGPTRSPLLPAVPTLGEFGMPDVVVATWYGILAPAGTPRQVLSRFNAQIVNVVSIPEHRKQLEEQGFEPMATSVEQFPPFLKAEYEKWGKIIKSAGIKLD
jgi:tripartite-type tricarboxylate transporter receptor subunit TctC